MNANGNEPIKGEMTLVADRSGMTRSIVPEFVLPALIADSLALGAHWIYDGAEIRRSFPEGVTGLAAPRSSYHPGKAAGDFTHYGDQTLALLRSVVRHGGFDAEVWRADWSRFWAGEKRAYRDEATRATLEALAHGSTTGSRSGDLGGAARIAPVLAIHAMDPLGARISAAREQTGLTHHSDLAMTAAEWVARWVDGAQRGLALGGALEEAAAATAACAGLQPVRVLDAVRRAADLTPAEAGAAFGLACNTRNALPLTLWLALRFADEPRKALVENATLGGDSAARGAILGLVMGALHGLSWIPSEWRSGLAVAGELDELLGLGEAPRALLAGG
jgi:ADP-ribosylglycohydrolase